MRLLTSALAALLITAPCAARADGVVGGVYDDGLLIGYDPGTHTVTGYFDVQSDGPAGPGQFSCIFYLTGALHGGAAEVSTWFPKQPADDLIKGRLSVETARQLRLQLKDEHGGCWNIRHFADAEDPADFTLEAAHPWTAVAVIRTERAYFYDTPGSAAHRKGYVVQGDGVGVRATRAGWLQVDFVSGDKPVSGWIKASDVY